MDKTQTPPYGNTGAQCTDLPPLRSLVDWVSATFTQTQKLDDIYDILGLYSGLFTELETGKMGYKRQLKFGHISILYDGQANMGIHVEMTGQGCREFERLSSTGWEIFFHMVMNFGHFSRLDLAIDDFKGYFKITYLIDRLKRGCCTSLFKKSIHIEGIKIEDGSATGNTLYFGSPTSRIKVRFYDKLRERIEAGKEIQEGMTFWNRTEVELRDERANAAAAFLLETKDVGLIVTGILKNYINFRKPVPNDGNKRRWPIAKFWSDFIGDVEKLKLTSVAPDMTVEKVQDWIDRQVETSLGMLFLAYDSNLDYVVQAINNGMEKLNPKHFAMINSYKEKRLITLDKSLLGVMADSTR